MAHRSQILRDFIIANQARAPGLASETCGFSPEKRMSNADLTFCTTWAFPKSPRFAFTHGNWNTHRMSVFACRFGDNWWKGKRWNKSKLKLLMP